MAPSADPRRRSCWAAFGPSSGSRYGAIPSSAGDLGDALQQRVEPRPRRHRTPASRSISSPVHPPADGPPEVLLEQPRRMCRAAAGPRHRHARNPAVSATISPASATASAELGLGVADPGLDRRKRLVRPHAPPDLGVLADRPGGDQEADVLLVLGPVGEIVGDPAAGKHAREDLRASRVQMGVAILAPGRAGRDREQLGEHRAHGAS